MATLVPGPPTNVNQIIRHPAGSALFVDQKSGVLMKINKTDACIPEPGCGASLSRRRFAEKAQSQSYRLISAGKLRGRNFEQRFPKKILLEIWLEL